MCFGGIFDFSNKKDRLAEVELELAEPSIWDDPEKAQSLGRERASLELVVHTIETLDTGHEDGVALLELAQAEDDQETADEVASDIEKLVAQLETLLCQGLSAFSADISIFGLDGGQALKPVQL